MSMGKVLSRCINIDWLEVYCFENIQLWPMNADYFRRHGWEVLERDYGTRSYKEMFTLCDRAGLPFIEVRRNPIGMFKNGERVYHFEPYGCHIRLVNRYCYCDKAVEFLKYFISSNGYVFSRIAKIDLALDFERFDSGDYPMKFVHRYVSGMYIKINQSNVSAFGRDDCEVKSWHSLSWGADRSPILTRLYDKTLELRDNDKPYIRQAWALAGLVDNPDRLVRYTEDGEHKPQIWRLEFSVRSAVKGWVTMDDESKPKVQGRKGRKHYVKISLRNNLDAYDSREKILTMFFSLAAHYFQFRHKEEGKSKYVSKPKVLFDMSAVSTFYSVEKVATSVKRDKLVERLILLLQKFNVMHYDRHINEAVAILIQDLETYQLKSMAVDRWDINEVRLLQALINRRLNNSDEPFAVSKEVAERFVQIERTLWDECSEIAGACQAGTVVPASDLSDVNP